MLAGIGLSFLLTYQLPAPTTESGRVHLFQDTSAEFPGNHLSFNSRDVTLSFPCAKNENLDLSCCFSVQRDRLIRTSLFDAIQVEILTQKLAWFIRPAYCSTLASLWRHSILIALSKLKI